MLCSIYFYQSTNICEMFILLQIYYLIQIQEQDMEFTLYLAKDKKYEMFLAIM